MKRNATLFFALSLVVMGYTQAQAQNPECMTNLSIFVEHAKVKNYTAAYQPWKMVRTTCPELHAATYAYGEKILKAKIETATPAEKPQFVTELLDLYDASLKYFPDKYKIGDVAIDKAIVIYEYKRGTDEEIYELLDNAFKKDRENFKNPKGLYLYFSTLVDLHNAGKKELQLVFDVYDDVTDRIDEEKKKLAKVIDNLLPKEEEGKLSVQETKTLENSRINAESFDKISASIDSKLGALADCGKLIPLYNNNFLTKKNDATWLKRAANRMDAKECSDDPLFIKIVEALHQLEPSAKSAYYLGFLNEKRKKATEAIKYYNESLELETDDFEKAKTAIKIAHKYKNQGQKATARNYANKALQYQPSMGKAYLLIASLYASSANECGNTAFEKRAIYWLAANVARKAGQVDSSLRGEAAQAASSYEQRAPSKTEIFTAGMAGKTVTFSCWVGGSVTVPNL